MDNVKFESESTMKHIRDVFRDRLKQTQAANQQNRQQADPRFGQPGRVPPNGGLQPPVGPIPPGR